MKLSNIFAGLSLLVSVATLLLTSPVLTDIYFSPELLVKEAKRNIEGDRYLSIFDVENKARKVAKDVELIMVVHSDAKVTIPGSNAEIIDLDENPESSMLKNILIKTPQIVNGNSMVVMVEGDLHDLIETSNLRYTLKNRTYTVAFPQISSLEFDGNKGEIIPQVSWQKELASYQK